KDCKIEGTTDFIFGQATAVFKDCIINSTSDSYITAASTPKEANFGFVFIDCKLTSSKGVKEVYLGRPWRRHAKTVFINTRMGKHILPKGWHDWGKTEAHSLSLYAEYNSTGPGANSKQRVEWSHQLTPKERSRYTLENILNSEHDKNWYLD